MDEPNTHSYNTRQTRIYSIIVIAKQQHVSPLGTSRLHDGAIQNERDCIFRYWLCDCVDLGRLVARETRISKKTVSLKNKKDYLYQIQK